MFSFEPTFFNHHLFIFMKKSLLFLFLVFALVACNKDKEEECIPPAVEKNILGAWSGIAKVDDLTSDPFDVTFNEDGTYADPEELLLGGEINDIVLTDRTWKIEANRLILRVSKGFNALSLEYIIKENSCDKIVIEYLDLGTVELRKKQ